jgi:NAD(P)-dependent dehydrogenase (short-subunit alcohol dehydrogenase family)
LANEIENAGGRALAVPLDVVDEASVITAFDAAQDAFGPIDGVVANAGITLEGRALDISISDFDQLFAVNVRAGCGRPGLLNVAEFCWYRS